MECSTIRCRVLVRRAVIALIVLCGVCAVHGRTSDILRVSLDHGGKLVGRYLVSRDGHGIRAFMGVPYARPPLADLRFMPPQPADLWQGERNAVADSPICIQRDPFRRDYAIEGSEDCLYLNVYTPLNVSRPLAVMVFFHGGGWQCGSGISAFYGPDYLLDHDIIYVGANFRLGPLGFLSTGEASCPGNNGLKDQVLVLRWIQENIEAFGGDKQRVTVFGESAGGASATYHMMSPLSKGLFSKAISQSGTNMAAWAQPAHAGVAPRRAAKLGEQLGCPKNGDNWAEMIECLRAKSAGDITAAFYDFFAWDTDPMIPFPPVVEPDLPGAFLTKHPREEKRPYGNGIPWMAGITLDEGAMKSAAFLNSEDLRKDLNTNWDRALPIALYYDHHDEAIQIKITKEINSYYFNNQKLTKQTEQNLTNLFTDSWFLSGVDDYIRMRLNAGAVETIAPTFVYLFAHKGAASFTEIFQGGRENYYGVSHAEELQFLFPIAQSLFVSAVPSAEDVAISRQITEMWVNFARNGNPAGKTVPKWPPTTKYPLNYLRIGNKGDPSLPMLALEKGLLDERAEFWRKQGAHLAAIAPFGGKQEL